MTAPNVVLILTDDQPKGLLDAMPVVRSRIRAQGLNISYGMAPSPLCGMTRASLITGRQAGHELGVWDNFGVDGGWQALAPYEGNTIATALQAVGLRTGLFGKYTNGWNEYSQVVPPGWDEFCCIDPDNGGDGDYYNYTLRGTVTETHFADTPADYSTDVLRDKALSFINTTPAEQPLFLYFAPYGAHANFTPAPRHIGTWTDPITLPPSFNESNNGKAPWLKALPLADEARTRRVIQDQHEVLMSVDEAIDQIMDALAYHERTDTLFLFAGDNGLMRGAHRLNGKYVPYQDATHLQMLARWDGHYTPGVYDRITTPVDLVATIVQATGANLPNSGVPLLGSRGGTFLEGALVPGERPAYIGWRTQDYLYIQWGKGFEELYHYPSDPHELTNVKSTKPDKLAEFRAKAEAAVSPRPPGWGEDF